MTSNIEKRLAALETRQGPAPAVPESLMRLIELLVKSAAGRQIRDLGHAGPVDAEFAMELVRQAEPELWGSPEHEVFEVVQAMVRVQQMY